MELVMNKNVTSEEKLLKLIRKKGLDKRPFVAVDEAHVKTSPDLQVVDVGSLKLLNRALLIFAVGILVYMGVHFLGAAPEKTAGLTLSAEPSQKEQSTIPAQTTEVQPFAYYQEKISQRDIFLAPWEKPKAAGDGALQETDFTKQISIVGLVMDENNPQVIVEDLQTHQTQFMSKGDRIAGAVLEDIKEGKVIFNYNNQPVEMSP